jgi:hypothetical protein
MSANAIVWWATLVAVVAVIALAGAQAARALRELNRCKARVAGYGELPVVKALENVEVDVQRIESAVSGVAPLVERAEAAIAVIRRGPVPPELIAAAQRLRAEIGALRSLASR